MSLATGTRTFALLAGLAAGAVVGLAAGLAGTAGAAPLRDCTPARGTIVAVDFAHWGGPIVRACGLRQGTGYALLHAAGFTTAGDARDGPAFVCRLGDSAFDHGAPHPTPAEQNCINTPPASAYWSDWLAPAGSEHWDYSELGAMSEVPKPGEVELWTFGATNIAGTIGSGVPSISPASLRRPANGGASAHVVTAGSSTQPAAASSATPLIIGIALAVLLGAGAAGTVWRRRGEE